MLNKKHNFRVNSVWLKSCFWKTLRTQNVKIISSKKSKSHLNTKIQHFHKGCGLGGGGKGGLFYFKKSYGKCAQPGVLF